MSSYAQVLEKLKSLTEWANSVIANAKKIYEFPSQNSLNTNSEVAAFNPNNNEVEKIKVSQIVENSLDNIPKSDSISSSSSLTVATSLAVKTVNDKVNTNISNITSLQTDIDSKATQLKSNQTNATVSLLDKNGNVLDTISVGFLNDEGTTLFYNTTNETIEIKSDDGNVLSAIPVSSFVSNVGSSLNLNGNLLELKDNNILSQVTLNFSRAFLNTSNEIPLTNTEDIHTKGKLAINKSNPNVLLEVKGNENQTEDLVHVSSFDGEGDLFVVNPDGIFAKSAKVGTFTNLGGKPILNGFEITKNFIKYLGNLIYSRNSGYSTIGNTQEPLNIIGSSLNLFLRDGKLGIGKGTIAPNSKVEIVNTDPTTDFLRVSSSAVTSGNIFKVDRYGGVFINNFSGIGFIGRKALIINGTGHEPHYLSLRLSGVTKFNISHDQSYNSTVLGGAVRIGASRSGVWYKGAVTNFGNRLVYTRNDRGLREYSRIGIQAGAYNEAITTVGTDRSRIRVLGNSSSGLMIEGGNTSSSYSAQPYANFHMLNGVFGNTISIPLRLNANGADITGKLKVSKSIQIGDDTDVASSLNEGATRYRSDSNNSYCEMCMQTGASIYEWIIIKQNTW